MVGKAELTLPQRLTVILAEAEETGDGWYWRLQVKWEDAAVNVRNVTAPFSARDDTGCGPLVLKIGLYLQLGESQMSLKFGRGFHDRIPHGVLTEEEKAQNRYLWWVGGMQMESLKFEPVFFLPEASAEDAGLASLPTLGWNTQPAAGTLGQRFSRLKEGID
jgi:hypothetical protein